MSPPYRGPSGEAPVPPKDFASHQLRTKRFRVSASLSRVHSSAYGPVFFGPGGGKPPTYRFDPESGRFGVLYVSPHPDGALIETLLRNPQRTMVDYNDIAAKSLSTLRFNRSLNLASFIGPHLSSFGLTASIFTGPYESCAKWSDALFDHPEQPDGILFHSRHDPVELCIALFERPGLKMTVEDTVPLTSMIDKVAELLNRHGKSIAGPM